VSDPVEEVDKAIAWFFDLTESGLAPPNTHLARCILDALEDAGFILVHPNKRRPIPQRPDSMEWENGRQPNPWPYIRPFRWLWA
jgi:peptidoglycan/xylan/chitin deacetylase (PgdA/CDA1 family)